MIYVLCNLHYNSRLRSNLQMIYHIMDPQFEVFWHIFKTKTSEAESNRRPFDRWSPGAYITDRYFKITITLLNNIPNSKVLIYVLCNLHYNSRLRSNLQTMILWIYDLKFSGIFSRPGAVKQHPDTIGPGIPGGGPKIGLADSGQ